MVHTLRSAFLLSILSSVASGCLAQGSAGFGVGGTTTGPSGPPPVAASDGAGGDPSAVQSGYGGPAGPMAPGAHSTTTAKPGEPRWDDFAFAVRERSGSYYGPWIISKLTTFKVGAACYAKLGDKDSGSLNQTSYYIRNVAALAKAWTGDDWGQIEGQHSDPSKDRVLVEPMIDAFGQRFHLTIAVEGDDCEVNRDAFWIRAWYTVSEAFAKYPPAAGKLNITLNVVAAARDITVAVDESGSNFTITAPRDFDSKDWGDKFERPFRKNAKSL